MANPEVTEESVYACTGKPRPSDMEHMLDWLLTASFQEASDRILAVQREQGVSLVDIVHGVGERVMALEMPPTCKYLLLDRLSDVECVAPAPPHPTPHLTRRCRPSTPPAARYNLSFATNEKLQLGALVGAFALARADMAKVAG